MLGCYTERDCRTYRSSCRDASCLYTSAACRYSRTQHPQPNLRHDLLELHGESYRKIPKSLLALMTRVHPLSLICLPNSGMLFTRNYSSVKITFSFTTRNLSIPANLATKSIRTSQLGMMIASVTNRIAMGMTVIAIAIQQPGGTNVSWSGLMFTQNRKSDSIRPHPTSYTSFLAA